MHNCACRVSILERFVVSLNPIIFIMIMSEYESVCGAWVNMHASGQLVGSSNKLKEARIKSIVKLRLLLEQP